MGLSSSKKSKFSDFSRETLLEEARLKRLESDNRLEYTVQYAQAGMKSLFLANGGAIIALITLVGNSSADVGPNGLFWAFVWFGFGLGSCLSAYFFGANSQDHLMNAAFNEALEAVAKANNTGESFAAKNWETKATISLHIAGGLAILSLILFLAGSFTALFAIT